MKPLVFAGPSLHGLRIGALESFDLAPPAACGDVMRAALGGRKVIGIIDGVFESGPAVWHKEILFAMAAGCQVLGASSMGALRAAECWRFGMIGVGAIFEDYRSGKRSSDADVALIHGPAELGYAPLSVPLVDVDDGIDRLLSATMIPAATASSLREEARRMHFKSRNWGHLLSAVGLSGDYAMRVLDWIAGNGPMAKARDAQKLIDRISTRPIAFGRPVPFAHTRFSQRLYHSIRR